MAAEGLAEYLVPRLKTGYVRADRLNRSRRINARNPVLRFE
jgi:hypothetical protein